MSVEATLVRHGYLPEVTLGKLFAGPLILDTLEEGWRKDPDGPGGQRREGALVESCIPDGTYTLRPHFSVKYPDGVWELTNPILGVYHQPGELPTGARFGRSAVLIHSGNTTDDIEGCILVGLRTGMDNGRHTVLDSRKAVAALREVLSVALTHRIHIRPTAGTVEEIR